MKPNGKSDFHTEEPDFLTHFPKLLFSNGKALRSKDLVDLLVTECNK